MGNYKKYSKEDQKLMASWSIDCSERVLHFFEDACPSDDRPRRALEVGRDWVRTGIFTMSVIRAASLGAHAAAKIVKEYDAACFAAHAAGQAVATAHVTQHAYGGSYYALKAIASAHPECAKEEVLKEFTWQEEHLPKHLQDEIMKRILITEEKSRIKISIDKGEGF